ARLPAMDVTVYLLPAPGFGPADLWYPHAQPTLGMRGFTVVAIPAPDPLGFDAWVAGLRAAHAAPGPVTILAHDLGALVALHWLEIGGHADYTTLVAPPDPASTRTREF